MYPEGGKNLWLAAGKVKETGRTCSHYGTSVLECMIILSRQPTEVIYARGNCVSTNFSPSTCDKVSL